MIEGPAANHALAFARIHEGRAIVLVCSRLLAGWDAQLRSDWSDTHVSLGAAHPALAKPRCWLNWLTGAALDNAASAPLADVLGNVGQRGDQLPFAVLVADDLLG